MIQQLPITCGRQGARAQVYAQVVSGLRLAWLWLRRIYRHCQEQGVCVLAVEQIGLTALARKHSRRVRTEAEGCFDPPIQCQQRDAIGAGEQANALVVDHRAVGAKRGLTDLGVRY
jgi:hypothetical protein